ncbi:hypothetical protein [Inquilinus limosus]|uniref:hypothetical protein n=1 Tax=Inquilinus limosus TaxID=171674 RepID=UPI000424592B|nr:hypothetical protein [Inquilinus limosus]
MPVYVMLPGDDFDDPTMPIVYTPIDRRRLLGWWRFDNGEASLNALGGFGGTLAKEGSPTFLADGVKTDWNNRLATAIADRLTCTVIVVARPASVGAPYRIQAVSSLGVAATRDNGRVCYLVGDSTGYISTRARDAAAGLVAVNSPAVPLSDLGGHRFSAHVFDQEAGELRLFAPRYQSAMVSTPITMGANAAGTAFRIGGPAPGGTQPSQSTEGVQAEVQIWGTALTEVEILRLYAESQDYWSAKGIAL